MFALMFVFAVLGELVDADYYNYLWSTKYIGTDFSKAMSFSYPVDFFFKFLVFIKYKYLKLYIIIIIFKNYENIWLQTSKLEVYLFVFFDNNVHN